MDYRAAGWWHWKTLPPLRREDKPASQEEREKQARQMAVFILAIKCSQQEFHFYCRSPSIPCVHGCFIPFMEFSLVISLFSALIVLNIWRIVDLICREKTGRHSEERYSMFLHEAHFIGPAPWFTASLHGFLSVLSEQTRGCALIRLESPWILESFSFDHWNSDVERASRDSPLLL